MRKLVQSRAELRSPQKVDSPVIAADVVERSDIHRCTRPVETVFGTVEIDRHRFHARGHGDSAPLGGELNLAPTRASFGVRRLVVKQTARKSFDDVVENIAGTTRARIAKRQAKELAVLAPQSFEALYPHRREQAAEKVEPSLLSEAVESSPAKMRKVAKQGRKTHRRRVFTEVLEQENHQPNANKLTVRWSNNRANRATL